MKQIVFFLFLLICFVNAYAQTDHAVNARLNVLRNKKAGKTIYFNNQDSTVGGRLEITYLGEIKTAKGTLRFLAYKALSGLYGDALKASSFVYLYDGQNNEIGHYYVGGEGDLPKCIRGQNLVFGKKDRRCNAVTVVCFKDSIPAKIFVWCLGNRGDEYVFEKY